jgi:hypothetical protein
MLTHQLKEEYQMTFEHRWVYSAWLDSSDDEPSFTHTSTDAYDSPTPVHLSLGELPVFAFALTKLDGRDPGALGFSEIGDQKGVANIHVLKWIGGSVLKEDLSGSFFY